MLLLTAGSISWSAEADWVLFKLKIRGPAPKFLPELQREVLAFGWKVREETRRGASHPAALTSS